MGRLGTISLCSTYVHLHDGQHRHDTLWMPMLDTVWSGNEQRRVVQILIERWKRPRGAYKHNGIFCFGFVLISKIGRML
jgi:hypothetical protein